VSATLPKPGRERYRPSMGERHIPELDGVRGIAILLVLVWHYIACQVDVSSGSVIAYSLVVSLRHTWSGVDLFFVLSGFLIGGILLDHRGTAGAGHTFWVRRSCRILPLYAVSVTTFATGIALNLGVTLPFLFSHPLPLASYATFTQNFAMALDGSLGPNWIAITWSLAVEEQFYLLLSLLILAAPMRLAWGAIGTLIVLAPILRAYIEDPVAALVLPFCRSDSILLGVLCAALVRHRAWITRDRTIVAVLSALIIVSLSCLWRPMSMSAVHLPLTVLYACILLLAVRYQGGAMVSVLRWRPLRWFGWRSFGLYLIHQPVAGLLHGILLGQAPKIDGWSGAITTICALLATMGLAELSFRYLEGPFLKLGKRYSYDAQPRLAQGAFPTSTIST
jgi:peptidoglycan/LPS O-acetylase OafA/YrhL